MALLKLRDGTELYYKDWGSGKPILFSHGWPLQRGHVGRADAVLRRARLPDRGIRSQRLRPIEPALDRL